MDLEGRRQSTNVEDRRGMSGGAKLGLGGGATGLIMMLLLMLCQGGGGGLDLGSILGQLGGGNMVQTQSGEGRELTQEEQELATFSAQILAGTEDVWTEIFKQQGWGEYTPPTLVFYDTQTSTGCGVGQSAMGPFYCSADQKLYIDLSFFQTMRQQLGADGDFAYAFVIAHEVGHHVEYLTGTLGKAHQQMSQYGQNSAKSNEISVRLELLADFYAGVWAHHDNKRFKSLQPGDLEEAIDCAQKIGDDWLQRKAQGSAVPETFTHGTSAQRMRWLKLGYQTGDVRQGRTFDLPYNQL
ncbi:MAG: neutral zinc metallopeptidase [Muribaculaceae bacterium]|nr:neutral zinc metallopeptidase [Muribaculaceae bacterium]